MEPAPGRRFRTALVGFGHGGRVFHAPLIEHEHRLDLTVVVTRSPESQAAARSAHPAAVVVATLEEALLEGPDLDLAVITTPNVTHAALAGAALARGLHVVVDKPFVVHPDDGERLIEAARAAGRLLVPFHNRRWDGDFLAVLAMVRSGALGRIRAVESAMESWKPSISKEWKRVAGPLDGGGVLWDLGPHVIDQAIALSGPAVPVFAELRREPDGAAENSAFVVLEHDGGGISHLHVGTRAPLVRPRFRVTGTSAGLTITGTDQQESLLAAGLLPRCIGAASGTAAGPTAVVGRNGHSEEFTVGPGEYPAFYAGVAAAMEGTGPVPVTAEDALDVVRMIGRIHAAFPARPWLP